MPTPTPAAAARPPPRRLALLPPLLFLSGVAGLGYQIVWARMAAAGIGHEFPAVLAVVAAFFCGLAAGALVLDGPIARSRRPHLWYAGLEAAIGLWAVALAALLPAANAAVAAAIGIDPSPWRHWGLAFGAPFFLFLPATAAMGATLPAAERLAARLRAPGGNGRRAPLGGLVAANTAGAVAGTLLAAFWMAPALGFGRTLAAFAGVNLLCAGIAALALGPGRDAPARRSAPVPPRPAAAGPSRALLATLFATGLLGIALEVVAVRSLAQVLEGTVYTFAAVLAVYLLGTSLGAAAQRRLAGDGAASPDDERFARTSRALLAALALACAGATAALAAAPAVHGALRAALGAGPGAAVLAELLTAAVALLPPTLLMGATFAHLAGRARGPGGGIGLGLAANTLGAAAAPPLVGLGLLPTVGALPTLAAIALGYLALRPTRRPAFRLVPAGAAAAAALLAAALGPPRLPLLDLPPGGRAVARLEGVTADVAAVEDAAGARYLKVDNRFVMGSTATAFSDLRQGHLPLLLHPAPARALFLGLGTGVTMAAAAPHPGLRAEGVELVPEVARLLPLFAPANGALAADPDLAVRVADARRYVRATPHRYDVVVADLFHPARDGAGLLYTAEHFRAIEGRLAPGGLFCQWLPLHQLDGPTLRAIVRTFLEVFPDATAHLGGLSVETPLLALVGGPGAAPRPAAAHLGRAADPALAAALAPTRLDSPFERLGGFLADAAALRALAGPGPLNTDDRPVVLFGAPRTVYGPPEPPAARLAALLDALPRPAASPVLAAGDDGPLDREFALRLGLFREARDRFLRLGAATVLAAGGAGAAPAADPAALEGELLAIVRLSPDFAAAYDPLLARARAAAGRDPATAARLLRALAAANPTRAEAGALLRRLGAAPG